MPKQVEPAPPPNYDYTGSARVARERKTLIESGGARVEAMLNADELARLDSIVTSKLAPSRRAALKYLVQQVELPGKRKKS